MAFDPDKMRPLEVGVTVHDLEKGEGRTERDLIRRNRLSADALFLIRSMVDDNELTIHYTSSDAKGELLDLESLWHMWICMTGHVAREAERNNHAPMQKFCTMVLHHMGLGADMSPLSQSQPVPPAVGDA
jgi:hypothetical protein